MSTPTRIFTPIALGLILIGCSNLANVSIARTVSQQPPASTSRQTDSRQTDLKSNTVADLAVELATTGNLEQALQLFDRALQRAEAIENQMEKTQTLSAIALKLAEVGQPGRSLQVFDQLVQQIPSETKEYYGGYFPDNALRDVAIQMAQAGHLDRALEAVRPISSGLAKMEALNGIATVLIDIGDLELAQSTVSEALQLVDSIPEFSSAYTSNGSCANLKFAVLSQIAEKLSLLAQVDRALDVARGLRGCHAAIGVLGSEYQAWAFMGILGHLADVDGVEQIWQSAQTMPIALEKIKVWSAIAVKLVQLGEPEFAVSIAERIAAENLAATASFTEAEIQAQSAKEGALRDIALQLAEGKDRESAVKVAEMLERPLMQTETKALIDIAIADALQAQGNPEGAERLLSQNLPLPQTSAPNGTPNDTRYENSSLAKIAVALAQIGQIDRALEILPTIEGEYTRSEARKGIMVTLAEAGQVDHALRLNQEKDLLHILESIAPQITNLEQIEQVLHLIETSGIHDGWRMNSYAFVAPKLIELGQIEQGKQLAQAIVEGEGLRGRIKQLANTIAQLAAAGEVDWALQFVDTLEDATFQAELTAAIAAQLIPDT